MKSIKIDDELYLHILSNTQSIGESASSILRRLLKLDDSTSQAVPASRGNTKASSGKSLSQGASEELLDENINEGYINKDIISENKAEVGNRSESVFNFINKEELAMQRGAVGRFLLILAALYRAHPKQFAVVTNIAPKPSARKIKRLYFALSEEKLTASGSSTKPKQVPQSPFWVITNSNTTRKKMMLTEAASLLGYDENEVIKIRELL